MEEMGRRFAGSLGLSDREAKGLKIGASAVQAAERFKFALVCKVLTPRYFRRRSFIDLFSRLWGGEKGVSISDVEEDRFLARFSCEEDLIRVLEREPWDFDKSLIVMGRVKDNESVTDVGLNSTLFWIQAHAIPLRYRTPEVASDVGGLVGEFIDVTVATDGQCVGRFLRIRVRMDISLALLRCTIVDFPGYGEQLVNFKYERLPEFCQECGIIGHPTRVCDEKIGIKVKADSERPYPLSLRAEVDLHGNRLGFRVSRGRGDVTLSGDGSEGGSGSQTWSRSEGSGFGERGGAASVSTGLLQIEGPTQDTATSPVKSVGLQTKSKGVIIAERFAAQQRLLQLEKVIAEKERINEKEEEMVIDSLSVIPNVDVGQPTVLVDSKLTLGVGGQSFLDTVAKRLGAVMKATFGSTQLGDNGGMGRGFLPDIKVENGMAVLPFTMGGNKVGVPALKRGGRKVVKVSSRRKLFGNQEDDKKGGGVEIGKRKKEDVMFDCDILVTKKAMLSTGIPEVVGVAGLPHHEK